MKKVLILLGLLCCLAGCGKYSQDDIINDFVKKVNNSKCYHLTGNLEIYRDEELYTYSVDSSYQEKDNFRVSLINQTNNHEQIILKNVDGVYVVTPSLNKSFKFQSEWPYNNSQIYLLQPIIRDLQNDSDKKFEEKDDEYIFTVKVNYDNDAKLVKQKIYLDKKLNLTKVEVLDKNDNVKMRLTIMEYDLKASFDDKYFKLGKNYNNDLENTNEDTEKDKDNQQTKSESNSSDKNVSDKDESSNTKSDESNSQSDESNNQNIKSSSSTINEIVYPMYVPVNTYLANQDKVSTENGERVILTFSGETPFLLVQETASLNDTTDFVNGDPYLILDTIGAVTDYSVSWINDGVEYSVVSDTMALDELITVAESISTVNVGK